MPSDDARENLYSRQVPDKTFLPFFTNECAMTFSIVGRDPEANKHGIAISTAFMPVGAICPFVNEHVAVASQAKDSGRTPYAEEILMRVEEGESFPEVCQQLLDANENSEWTQLHGIDVEGGTFAHTGSKCTEWAGGREAENHTVAGNILAGSEVVEAMGETFVDTTGCLEDRLLTALKAGDDVGGDRRGNISSALLVYAPESKLYHNLRIDHSDNPIDELLEAYEAATEWETEIHQSADEDLDEELIGFDVKY